MELEDPETGERFVVDTSRPAGARPLRTRRCRRARDERRQLFRKLELDHVELRAGEDHGEALARFFRARARRMAA